MFQGVQFSLEWADDFSDANRREVKEIALILGCVCGGGYSNKIIAGEDCASSFYPRQEPEMSWVLSPDTVVRVSEAKF